MAPWNLQKTTRLGSTEGESCLDETSYGCGQEVVLGVSSNEAACQPRSPIHYQVVCQKPWTRAVRRSPFLHLTARVLCESNSTAVAASGKLEASVEGQL